MSCTPRRLSIAVNIGHLVSNGKALKHRDNSILLKFLKLMNMRFSCKCSRTPGNQLLLSSQKLKFLKTKVLNLF